MEEKKNFKKVIMGVVAATVIVGVVLGMSSCKKDGDGNNETNYQPTPIVEAENTVPEPTAVPSGGNQVFIVDENAVDKKDAIEVKKNPLSGRNVFFAGYSDAVLTKTSTVALENLPENEDFYLKYVITDKETNTVVYETNLIPSGQCVVWTPGETMEAGVYQLQFLALPYYHDGNGNYQPLTSGCNDVQYTIK